MKAIKPSEKELLSLCSEIRPDDGVDPRTFFRKPSGRKDHNRKVLQLCGAIARTLSLVLSWESRDDLLRTAIVQSVEPAPDSTRVLVTVSAPDNEAKADQLLARLNQSRGRLRTEVATAIHRKKVPELIFRVIETKEGDR
jgi:ribosome-binding factor A